MGIPLAGATGANPFLQVQDGLNEDGERLLTMGSIEATAAEFDLEGRIGFLGVDVNVDLTEFGGAHAAFVTVETAPQTFGGSQVADVILVKNMVSQLDSTGVATGPIANPPQGTVPVTVKAEFDDRSHPPR